MDCYQFIAMLIAFGEPTMFLTFSALIAEDRWAENDEL